MPFFLVQPEDIAGGKVFIRGEDARHLSKVLRCRPGEEITVMDGEKEYTVVVEKTDGREVVGRITAEFPCRREPPLPVVLYQGVAKGEKMDLVVQKATEIGVTTLVPVLTERVVVRLDAAKGEQRRERWQRIAREAAKQAGRGRVPLVEKLHTWPEAVARAAAEGYPAVVLWEKAERGLKEFIAARPRPAGVSLFIGPEGGLAEAEVELARQQGFAVARLGPRILRTETAGTVAAALFLFAWGDLG